MRISDIASSRPAVMGILNVTPDSFSDGGKYFDTRQAVEKALQMADEGADIIDIGGESTRPGAEPVTEQEELKRVIPVIERIKKESEVKISCDTSKPVVAGKALEAGADMINDVSGLRSAEMRKIVVEHDAAVCIMHMKGSPGDMQSDPQYGDVLEEIRSFLYEQAEFCQRDGLSEENIIIDPGIGFGKTLAHNLKILANVNFFSQRYPVMIGASRKSFLGMILNEPVENRLAGSLAVACCLAMNGVWMLRVHDVRETRKALKIMESIRREHERDSADN